MHDVKDGVKKDVELEKYQSEADQHDYIDDLTCVESVDSSQWLNVGVDIKEMDRAGTFIQKDCSVIHSKAMNQGVEVMGISDALKKHDWLTEYLWKYI